MVMSAVKGPMMSGCRMKMVYTFSCDPVIQAMNMYMNRFLLGDHAICGELGQGRATRDGGGSAHARRSLLAAELHAAHRVTL